MTKVKPVPALLVPPPLEGSGGDLDFEILSSPKPPENLALRAKPSKNELKTWLLLHLAYEGLTNLVNLVYRLKPAKNLQKTRV
jgi:hypothetical protein